MNRLATLLICVLILGAAIYTIIYNENRYENWKINCEVIEVIVESGDTLDEFGYKYKPEWMDVREYRSYIKELNNIGSSQLYVGQILKLLKEGC